MSDHLTITMANPAPGTAPDAGSCRIHLNGSNITDRTHHLEIVTKDVTNDVVDRAIVNGSTYPVTFKPSPVPCCAKSSAATCPLHPHGLAWRADTPSAFELDRIAHDRLTASGPA